jgi:hypothetical protein
MSVHGRVVLAALLAAGCGSSMGKPVAQFPSKAKLEEMAARPEKPVAALKTASVDAWQIASPVPAPGAPYPQENHWDEVVARTVASRSGVRASAELRCAAQEAARFYLQQGAYPDDSLRAFLVARCGSTLPSAQIGVVFSDVPAGVSEAALQESFDKSASQLLQRELARSEEIALAFAAGNGRATLVSMAGKPLVRLQRFSSSLNGSVATLTGQVEKDVGFVTGFVSQGEYGVKFCEPDRTQKLPAFRLDCPVAEQDAEATVELVTGKPNQLFWHLAARAVLRRDAAAGLVYQSRSVGTNQTVSNPRAFTQAFLAGLNQVRRQVGVAELAFEGAQSSTNERFVPHFFANMLKGNEWMLDEIGLGLLAGWDVNGMIRTGSIYSSLSESSRNPGRFLADALGSPFGRWMLLEPEMTHVAIGSGALDPNGVMALVTTYSFFDSDDHRSDETAIFEELGKVRKARGVAPAQRVPNDGALRTALRQVAANALRSDEALNDAMERISAERRRGVAGYVLETSDLHHLEFPDVLLGQGAAEVEVGVTHYKARGGAWGQYVIFFVVLQGTPGATAGAASQPKF